MSEVDVRPFRVRMGCPAPQGRGKAGGIAVTAIALLTGCTPAVLDPAGPVALADRTLLIDSVAIMLVIVVPTILATLAFAWWFRSGNARARRRPDWAYSGRIEVVTWTIPLLTIVLLGGVAWVGSHQLDPARPLPSKPGVAALEVQVVALDWKWLFIYPGQGAASVNQLVIPAGRPVHFTLTSASVMNAFFIPQLGSMIYAMNGMRSELNLQADQPGTFRGISSHYSGDGFSDMHFAVRAVDAAAFDGWIAGARNGGPSLDDVSYAELAKQTINPPPSTFRQVEPGLFEKVVAQTLAPGPGPAPEPNPKTRPQRTSELQRSAPQDVPSSAPRGAVQIAGQQTQMKEQ